VSASGPEVVAASDASAVTRVVDVLDSGGVVVLPTDTVYGLAASARLGDAVGRLFTLKGRRADVPIAVLCADHEQAFGLTGPPHPDARLLAGHWPGPLTLVLPRRPGLEWQLGEPAATIGVRCPDHDLVRAVAAQVGPLATTSANRHGVPTPVEAAAAAASLTGPVDLVVDGGTLVGEASTVVDLTGPVARVLRQGVLRIGGGNEQA
jgi:L-threonylcarbamoyladenylate synthase